MNDEMIAETLAAPLPGVTEEARAKLRGHWGRGVLFTFYCFLLLIACSVLNRSVPWLMGLNTLLSAVVGLAFSRWALIFSRTGEMDAKAFEFGFRRIGVAVWAEIVMGFYILLWMLLLIIPGILAALNYSMTLFILAENRNISVGNAIRRSKKMMYGHRWKLFLLILYFFLLSIGALLTCGIGFLWLVPYINVSYAGFYDRIKPESEEDLPEYPGMSIEKVVLLCIVVMLFGALQGHAAKMQREQGKHQMIMKVPNQGHVQLNWSEPQNNQP